MRLVSLAAKSGMLVTPISMAPAARSFADDGGVAGRNQLVPGKHVAAPAVGGDESLDAGVGFGDDGHAPQRAGLEAGRFRFGIFTGGLRQRRCGIHRLYRAIDAVVAGDAVEVPLDHLGDGVAVFAIELVQTIDGDVHEIAIHGGLTGCVWTRRRGAGKDRRHDQEREQQHSHDGTIASERWMSGGKQDCTCSKSYLAEAVTADAAGRIGIPLQDLPPDAP